MARKTKRLMDAWWCWPLSLLVGLIVGLEMEWIEYLTEEDKDRTARASAYQPMYPDGWYDANMARKEKSPVR